MFQVELPSDIIKKTLAVKSESSCDILSVKFFSLLSVDVYYAICMVNKDEYIYHGSTQ